MDIGWDLYPVENEPTFRGHTIIYSKELDKDKSNPVYLINHNSIGARVLGGDVFRETAPDKSPKSHNAYVGWVNLSCSFMCTNRSRHAVIAQDVA